MPERVVGGYYIRGSNQLTDDATGTKLVERIEKKLAASSLNDKIEFFYIPDPAPISDEDLEMGEDETPLILVTRKNETVFFDESNGFTKFVISALGLSAVGIFSLGSSVIQSYSQDRLDQVLTTGNGDISWIVDNASTLGEAMIAILLAHELAHRMVAWSYKVGLNDSTC